MNNPDQHKYDVSIIRPQMRAEDVRLRREPMAPAKAEALRKALLASLQVS